MNARPIFTTMREGNKNARRIIFQKIFKSFQVIVVHQRVTNLMVLISFLTVPPPPLPRKKKNHKIETKRVVSTVKGSSPDTSTIWIKAFHMLDLPAVWLYRGVDTLGNPVTGKLHLYTDKQQPENSKVEHGFRSE